MNSTAILRRLDIDRVASAKKAYATHRVPRDEIKFLIEENARPMPGDLVLARVDQLGHHTKLELSDGRRAQMYVGDEIIVCFGNRYATAQFEALIGMDLSPCHLVAAGGIAGTVSAVNDRARRPTGITPLGFLAGHDGERLNLKDHALPPSLAARSIPTLVVVGTSMKAGKTETAAQLIRGLDRAGYKVGAAKITGTGAGGDRWQMIDAGAREVLDFTDAGYATTYKLNPRQVETIYNTLVGHLVERGSDVAVLEIADGLFQKETIALLGSLGFGKKVDALLFAATDAIGAVAGTQWLASQSLPLVAVSGLVTCSPLSMREVQSWTDIPVLETKTLSDPAVGAQLWGRLMDDKRDDRRIEEAPSSQRLAPRLGAIESQIAI